MRACWGYGLQEVTGEDSGMVLGKPAREGESPVYEIRTRTSRIQSTARHVEPCGKSGGPPPKAKYSLVTDSA